MAQRGVAKNEKPVGNGNCLNRRNWCRYL